MWIDRRKKHTVTFKVDDYEMQIIRDIMESNDIQMGEAIRRALWVYRVLYANNLKFKDAIREDANLDEPLATALKSIPELSHIIGLELELWKRQSNTNKNNSIQ